MSNDIEESMKQKNLITFFSLLVFIHSFIGSDVLAEPVIKDQSEVVGTWLLEATAIRKGGEKTPEQAKWVFSEDGTLTTTSFYKFSGLSGQAGTLTERFEIKDGALVGERSGTFKLIEKQGNEMILKGPFGYYFFKKE
jgi:hypothetical protein